MVSSLAPLFIEESVDEVRQREQTSLEKLLDSVRSLFCIRCPSKRNEGHSAGPADTGHLCLPYAERYLAHPAASS